MDSTPTKATDILPTVEECLFYIFRLSTKSIIVTDLSYHVVASKEAIVLYIYIYRPNDPIFVTYRYLSQFFLLEKNKTKVYVDIQLWKHSPLLGS